MDASKAQDIVAAALEGSERAAFIDRECGDDWQVFLENFTAPDPDVAWMATEAREELDRLTRSR